MIEQQNPISKQRRHLQVLKLDVLIFKDRHRENGQSSPPETIDLFLFLYCYFDLFLFCSLRLDQRAIFVFSYNVHCIRLYTIDELLYYMYKAIN